MSLPPNIRVNVGAPFPARVQPSGPVAVSKANGIWTIGLNYANLVPISSFNSTQEIAVFDPATGLWNVITLASLLSSTFNNYRIVSASGDVTVLPADLTILMDKSVGAATNILLPTSASRKGLPITVKDYKGDANANNITFVPQSGETIDGLTSSQAALEGISVIDTSLGKKTIYPLTSGGWYF